MKFTSLNAGIMVLLLISPGVYASDLELPRESNGEISVDLPSAVDADLVSPYAADGPRAWFLYQSDGNTPGGSLQLAAASPSARYQDECSDCHGDADEFVRESLTVRNGTLIGLGSEMPVLEFLKTHRKLKPAEVDFYMDLLKRVAGEIGLQ